MNEKKLKYFEGVPRLGDLYLEHVFTSFDNEPIIFVCSDENFNLFLCLCSEIRGTQRWILSSSTVQVLEDLIDHKIDLYSALKNLPDEYKYIIEMDIEGNETFRRVLFDDIDELDLPCQDTYLEYFDKEWAYSFINPIKDELDSKLFIQFVSSYIYNSTKKSINNDLACFLESINTDAQLFCNISSTVKKGEKANTYQGSNKQHNMVIDLSPAA